MQLELLHQSEESEKSMHYSQPQRYIVSMSYLFLHLLVFETHTDSYFYYFFVSHFLFHSINFVNFILDLFCMFSEFYCV